MKRWQLIVFMLLATATWTATGPVSADEKCYDNKGNPIPCPPTKEEPSPTKGGSATADRPPATKTPKSTLTPTPSPKWTPPPLASTETGTPSATLTQSVIIAASTNPPDEVYTPPPPRPCIPWLQIVLGALGGLFTGAALTIGTMGFTLFQQNGFPVRASTSLSLTESSRHSHLRGRPLLTLPAVISSVWFRVGIITIGIALSAAALTDLNSLAPCNDWPAAGGVGVALGFFGIMLIRLLSRSVKPTVAGTEHVSDTEDFKTRRNEIDKILPSWAKQILSNAAGKFLDQLLRNGKHAELSKAVKDELEQHFNELSDIQTNILTFYFLAEVIELISAHLALIDSVNDTLDKMNGKDMDRLQEMMEEKSQLESMISNCMKAAYQGAQDAIHALKV